MNKQRSIATVISKSRRGPRDTLKSPDAMTAFFKNSGTTQRLRFQHLLPQEIGGQRRPAQRNLNLKAQWNVGKPRAPDSRGIAS